MKQFIINHSLQLVTDIYPDYDSSKLDEIRYGLEAIYLSLTKVVAILLVSLLLGLFKEAVILLFFFNGLRSFAFGIHATKSWMCWIASSLLFIGLPYVCLHLNMPLVIQYFILAVTYMLMHSFAFSNYSIIFLPTFVHICSKETFGSIRAYNINWK